jgi:hypothetical protein
MIVHPSSISKDDLLNLVSTGHMRVHFSQFGEDAVLWSFLQSKRNGFYVDVGAHHPLRYSNTALFHIFNGWSGINIDVDQRAIDEFNIQRPRDINVRAGVGLLPCQLELTLFDDGALNTFDTNMATDPRWNEMGRRTEMVDVFPLKTLLLKYLPVGRQIDLLNVDVEGLDIAALQSNDWSLFRPRYVSVEVHGFDLRRPTDNPLFVFLNEQGYGLTSHAFATSIYVDTRNTSPLL